jgi:uncharacterized membrane protein YcaP (DUF421 family)
MDLLAILKPDISVVEKIVRPLIVYFFLLGAFKIAGKRELGQLTPFDLVVLLTISNVLQNAMIGNDNSLGGGLIGAMTLLSANGILARLAARYGAVSRLFEDEPTVLIEDGIIRYDNLKKEVMTEMELKRSIRKHDLDPETDLPRIHRALLESDGTVTIHMHENRDRPV